jgi:NitT/TauT family transport system substrate-binding protein
MSESNARPARWPALPLVLALLAVASVALLSAGCGGQSDKIKISYLGLTCEPPIFVAYEKGFFKEEGLDVELVKSDWDSMRDGLGLGRFHATHHLVMYMMKPMEVGLDVKLTGGIHTGCLRLQAGKKTGIKNAAQLKGKKIGITHMGSPPFLFASRVLVAQGLNPMKDVEWVTVPGDTMALALDKGLVDAVASAEPIGTMLIAKEKVDKVSDQAIDAPYDDEYCCAVVVNGKFARERPAEAAKVTRALLKGAKWVSLNPVAAARLAVEKKYVAATAEINAQAIRVLKYEPGVSKARRDILTAAKEMKRSGFLKESTDPEELARKAWLDLDGVTDEWVKGLKVEKVSGGGPVPELKGAEFAAIFSRGPMCDDGGGCMGCCDELGRGLMPLTGPWALVRPLRLDRELNPEGGIGLGQSIR